MAKDLVGKSLGPFDIEKALGSGAMGSVYRARHRTNGKIVAIKVMNEEGAKDPTFVARFEREIKLLSQFQHPNIVRIYGASEYQGIRYYAMELIEGQNLQDILSRCTTLPLGKVIKYIVQLCEALQQMHSVGIVHRDLKPANVMITYDDRVKLTDFGIAKDVTAMNEDQLTRADRTVGTIAYMSPEQLGGKPLTPKSDLYALGLILYRMVTGRLPFMGDTMVEYMSQRMAGSYPLPSAVNRSLPREFDRLITSLLSENLDHRPRDAYAVMKSLLDIKELVKEGGDSSYLGLTEVDGTVVVDAPPSGVAGSQATAVRSSTRADVGDPKSMSGPAPAGSRGMSSLLSLSWLRGTGTTSVKKKKKGAASQDLDHARAPWESPWLLGGGIVVCLAILAYVFLRPLSTAERVARIQAVFENPDSGYFDKEIALDRYQEAIRTAPDGANYMPKLLAWREQAYKEHAAALAQAILRGVRSDDAVDPAINPETPVASRAAKGYVEGLRELKREDFQDAVAHFRAVRDSYATATELRDRVWGLLAAVQADELEPKVRATEEADYKTAEQMLAAAHELEATNRLAAVKQLETLIEKYAGKPHVASIVESAKTNLDLLQKKINEGL